MHSSYEFQYAKLLLVLGLYDYVIVFFFIDDCELTLLLVLGLYDYVIVFFFIDDCELTSVKGFRTLDPIVRHHLDRMRWKKICVLNGTPDRR